MSVIRSRSREGEWTVTEVVCASVHSFTEVEGGKKGTCCSFVRPGAGEFAEESECERLNVSGEVATLTNSGGACPTTLDMRRATSSSVHTTIWRLKGRG